MYAQGQLTEIVEGKGFIVFVPFPDTYLLEKREITRFHVEAADNREASDKQKHSVHMLISYISKWSGHWKNELRQYLKDKFCYINECEPFSMRSVDMTTCREFITYLVDFCIHNNVPMKHKLSDLCEDSRRYVYKCLEYQKCAVCGITEADIHHCTGTRIGMGRDRRQIIHEGLVCISLCGKHHNLCHNGEADFLGRERLVGVALDKYLCKTLGYKTEAN